MIGTSLEEILDYMNRLTPEHKPLWGKMSAQRMIEHLTDSTRIATGENPQQLMIPEDKIERMLLFLDSDKPMAREISVPFATEEMNDQLRHEEIDLAIDEFVDVWLHFEEVYENNPEHTEIHPFYGPLNYKQWLRLSQKHFTHHFTQFGLIEG